MNYDFLTNSNLIDKNPLSYLIPTGTLAKAVFSIKPGNSGPDGWLTQSKRTGSVYLGGNFKILEGEYEGRKIFQCIGLQTLNSKENLWGHKGHLMIRSIIESGHGFSYEDTSERAIELRKIGNPDLLNGLTVAVRIGVEYDRNNEYPPKNCIREVIAPPDPRYYKVMSQSGDQTISH